MNFCILHQHLYRADGFQIPPQTQMLQRCMPYTNSSMLRKIIVGSLILFSCNQSQEKTKNSSSDTLVTKIDTNLSSTQFKITTDTFSIENLIPEYRNDTNFHKISGLQIRTGVQQIYYYSIYRMPKKKVVDNFNKPPKIILLTKSNGQKEYAECKKIDNKYFFDRLYEEGENNTVSQNYFYKFRKLKEFEIYAYFSPAYMHQIIFDKNSDTVYHRIRDVIF
jgi:hypothetical protein